MGDFLVNLLENWCDCGKFQALHLPCSHVIAACAHSRQAYQMYINDVYKAASVFSVYDNNFPGIEDQSYWPVYHDHTILPNPEMKKERKVVRKVRALRQKWTILINRIGVGYVGYRAIEQTFVQMPLDLHELHDNHCQM
jgi:hypothetical protein